MLQIGAAFYELRTSMLALYDEGEASAIAHEVLHHITGLGRLERLQIQHQELSSAQEIEFLRIKNLLLDTVPMQYALGAAHFMGRRFKVSSAVLIPRPETEELVQWILAETSSRSILDIGTGSGCIAVSLALALPDCAVTALDISEEALSIAKENAEQLSATVHFQKCNFLEKKTRELLGRFDVIASNPPYIPEQERERLHPNVREHEPATALFVPSEDSLLFYRAIADFGKQHLSVEGSIYCELHRDFAEATATLFRQEGYRDVRLREDMQGNPRMLRARL